MHSYTAVLKTGQVVNSWPSERFQVLLHETEHWAFFNLLCRSLLGNKFNGNILLNYCIKGGLPTRLWTVPLH